MEKAIMGFKQDKKKNWFEENLSVVDHCKIQSIIMRHILNEVGNEQIGKIAKEYADYKQRKERGMFCGIIVLLIIIIALTV